jgi:hypothetical protein
MNTLQEIYEINHSQSIIHVVVGEPFNSVEKNISFWRKAIAECVNMKYTRLLIENKVEHNLTPVEMYDVSRQIVYLTQNLNIKIAYVDNCKNQKKVNKVGNAVGKWYGMNTEGFCRLQDAKEWLLHTD